jgi:hypothetical protein
LFGEIAGAGGRDADSVARNIEAGDNLFKGLEGSNAATNTCADRDHGAVPVPAFASFGGDRRSVFRQVRLVDDFELWVMGVWLAAVQIRFRVVSNADHFTIGEVAVFLSMGTRGSVPE